MITETVKVGFGTRFVNFAIDNGFLLALLGGTDKIMDLMIRGGAKWEWLIAAYLLYFFVAEWLFGKTLGQHFTMTRPAMQDGKRKVPVGLIFLRTLLRPVFLLDGLVMFFVNRPLHDWATGTTVIEN
jgi:hypothetical protein